MSIPTNACQIGILTWRMKLKPFPIITDKIFRLDTSTLINQCCMKAMKSLLWKPVHFSNTKCIIPEIT